ncbi:MAG: insulinase family protein [Polyangiaceae bacterium]
MPRTLRMLQRVCLALLLVCWATPAPGADTPRATATQSGKLPNGVRFSVAEDRDAPMVAIAVSFAVGSGDDPAAAPGLAQLVGGVLEHADTRHLRDRDRAQLIRALGGYPWEPTVSVGPDYTTYSVLVPASAFKLALWLAADRAAFFADGVSPASVTEALQGLRAPSAASGEEWLSDLIAIARAAQYGRKHPYAHVVDPSLLQKLDARVVRNWVREQYVASRLVVNLAGQVDAKDATALIKQYFGDIATGSAGKRRYPTEKVPAPTSSVAGAGSALVLLWHTPRYMAAGDVELDVAARMLRERLGRRLTGEAALAKSVWVQQASRVGGSDFHIAIVSETSQHAAARKVIDEELAVLQAGKADPAVARGIALMQLETAQQHDELIERARWASSCWMHVGRPSCYQDYAGSFRRVTEVSVARVVRRYLSTAPFVVRAEPGGTGTLAHTDKASALAPVQTAPQKDAAFRYQPPGIDRAASFEPAFPVEFQLSNGARALVFPNPTVGVVRLTVGVNWRGAPPVWYAPTLFSDLVASARLKDGTKLSERLNAIPVHWERWASSDDTEYAVRALPDKLEPALQAIVEGFTSGELSKDVLEHSRDGLLKSMDSLAPRNELYQWIGATLVPRTTRYWSDPVTTRARLRAIQLPQLEQHRKQQVVGGQLFFLVSGPVEPGATRETLERSVKGLPARPAPPPKPIPLSKGVFLVDDGTKDAVELALVVPLGTSAKADYAANLALRLFFGLSATFTPNLTRPLAARSLSDASIRANVFPMDDQTDAEFRLYVSLKPDQLTPFVEALLEHMTTLREAPVHAASAAAARRELVDWLLERYSNARNQHASLVNIIGQRLGTDADLSLLRRIRHLSPADLQDVAKRYYRPEALRIVAVGPVKDAKPALEKLGLGPVRVLTSPLGGTKK